MFKRLLCAVAITLCFFASAQAQAKTDGNILMQICVEERACDFFMSGLVTGLMPLANAAKCMPDGVTIGQAKDTLLKYIKSNPSKRHMHISALFDYAMEEAFGCEMVFFRGYVANENYAKTKRAPR